MINRPPLELWGGVECTVNRVNDEYFDQVQRSGHAARSDDLDLFAGLGLHAMRYPILWERTAPATLDTADWSWPDERLNRLRDLGIRPIVSLVHHGSGPRHTNLLDPNFAPGLAQYARAVAERYPHINDYLPVNEPLTTARFGGQYGIWHPHGRDGLTFARVLLNQCRAIVLAMRAIREVNPAARLVQNEDIGKTHSTSALAYQAAFENERRWITFDLLCGRVDREHRMWQFLRWSGIEQAELEWFLENPCPPDILGIDYYLTSERFLDEHLEAYPHSTHGGNGRHDYADLEAVRVCQEGVDGPVGILREAWDRYALPVAATEAHLGCTRDEQLRWMHEIWRDALTLHDEGVDIRAVTAWALLGLFDWHCLLTRCEDVYEPGAFDLRAPRPRPTALAHLLPDLAAGRRPNHPVLAVPGWWRRDKRLLYPAAHRHQTGAPSLSMPSSTPSSSMPSSTPLDEAPPSILITGAATALGHAFARLCDHRGLPHRALAEQDLDIADAGAVEDALQESRPWAIINAAAYADVDGAEHEPDTCFRLHSAGPATLAAACAQRAIPLLTFSSDQVFDGTQSQPYVESDAPRPLGVYGRSQAQAERQVLQACPSALIARVGTLFGPWDIDNFVITALREVAVGRTFAAPNDVWSSPTYAPDLVHAALDLLIDGERGLWHLANIGSISPFDLARRAANLAGLDAALVHGRPLQSFNFAAPRPRNSSLASERGTLLQPLDAALDCYFRDCEVLWMQNDLSDVEEQLKHSRRLVA